MMHKCRLYKGFKDLNLNVTWLEMEKGYMILMTSIYLSNCQCES